MRKVVFLGVVISLLLFLFIFAQKEAWVGNSRVPTELKFEERSPEFRAFEIKALAGSIDAANALMDYHSKCHTRDNLSPDLTPKAFKQCAARVAYWTTIALENGSSSAAQRYTNVLLNSKKCRDIHRAEFWFDKFREHFSSDRVFLESVAGEIREKKRSCAWQD